MSEHKPSTYVTAAIDEYGTRLNVHFYTPDLWIILLGIDRERPVLSVISGEAQVSICTTGGGPVTEQDVTLARQLADAAASYLAECERLHSAQTGEVAA
ncbi:hypothetical protein [Nonomuraea pusilla]|uniref:Uncharacterized protein n=1 Tax=Nonomuraea pusilla TaxID=46177 RepID=A0A1H7ZPW9_9ACTN|nr:hypothetical protein [Nonomuraea pusilla]SEM59914.1 hypothetical protein SAMN05660976_05543 [Nonomuraea pusilla]